ncbi:N-acyl-D-amino-acid deacylase family protein [Endozoicomonas ascidiicola]|uniref:N-acyl-D-amino-acid deacylase family protein n=1 Tax=Endozoicomonas ascidiicola TaxID=1698521 RepID=UPI000B2FB4F5|nr:D-aminoacylase [Endozoicomonas ascidiicola]
MSTELSMYDLIFSNAIVIDGSGSSRYTADIAVQDGVIVEISEAGSLRGAKAKKVIDCLGLAVAPGFIDVHTHDDNAVLMTPLMEPKVSQGVTTVIVGNCGISLSPMIKAITPPDPLNLLGNEEAYRFPTFKAYGEEVERIRPNVNVGALIGHSTLRVNQMEKLDREATSDEIGKMIEQLREGLENGALGMSSGLAYPTAFESKTDEIVELARNLKEYQAIYTTHLRDEYAGILDAMDEAFETAKCAESPLIISHHKCAGPENWGRTQETLAAIDNAAEHIDVGMDCYPYIAGSSTLDLKQVKDNVEILITWSDAYPEMSNRYLRDIAQEWECSLMDAAKKLQPAGATYFIMSEEDVSRVLSHRLTMIGSDGLPHDPNPHPRLWGAFPRVLGHYSREEKLFSLEEAVHKMTGLSAKRFRLEKRGYISKGFHADLVIFNADTINDLATFENPKQAAVGIEHVIVNGEFAIEHGQLKESRSGKMIRRGE